MIGAAVPSSTSHLPPACGDACHIHGWLLDPRALPLLQQALLLHKITFYLLWTTFMRSRTLGLRCHRVNIKCTFVFCFYLRQLLLTELKQYYHYFPPKAGWNCLLFFFLKKAQVIVCCVFGCCNSLHVMNQSLQGPAPAPPSCSVCLS